MFFQTLNFMILSTSSEPTPLQNNADNMNDIIGIGGILATLIVGFVTCLITWKLTMRSIKQQRLRYNKKILNILSNSIQEGALADLSITIGSKELKNPYLLLLEIENTGNEAIDNPPLSVRAITNTKMIPGYFQDVPPGYENIWKMQQSDDNSCNICLEHINPMQIVKVCIFLDDSSDVIIECPMKNVIIQETTNNSTNPQGITEKFNRTQKITIMLSILTIILFISMDFWMEFLYTLDWHYKLLAPPIGIALFVLSTLLFSIILNVFGINKLDAYILKNRINRILIKSILLILSTILTFLILYNIIIVNYFLQVITAIVVVFMLSELIHLSSINQ